MLRTASFLTLFLALARFSTLAEAIQLARDGRTPYSIVIASNAIPSERHAAEELRSYLGKMSGAEFPIVTEAPRGGRAEIVLGQAAASLSDKLRLDWDELGQDGFVLRTMGRRRLIIAGGQPRGTLNGVYALLEDRLGVRWFTPELEVVPRTNLLVLPTLNQVTLPQLENREVFWTEMMRDADFAARHRLNGHSHPLQARHGGRFTVYQPFVHSFDALIPPALYSEHPEYFPFINGKRAAGYVQRCLSNPDVLKLSIAKVREWIRDHPQATIISVSQNDTYNYCQCDACKSLDDAEGTPAASLLRYVNAIAEDIQRDYPRVRIDTLAYQYTRKPPKTIRPRSNVIIRLCSIECCFAHSLEGCSSEANARFRGDIIAWRPVAPLLYVWDYTPNFAHYQQPFPNFDALQENVRFFVRHNVKGLFEQGNYSPGGAGELAPLRAYVLAKLLWNPDCDVQMHTHEFCAAYYGRAAEGILEYVELLQKQVRGKNVHAHIFDPPSAAYLGDGFISSADKLLEEAAVVAGDGRERERVDVARLPIWYVQLARNLVPEANRKALLTRFLGVARKAGVSHISEAQDLATWAKRMGAE